MAGDQNSFWFPGREALSTPSPQPLHHSHDDAPLYCSPTISGSCTGLLPQGATAISPLGALQHGLLSEPQYVLPQNSGDCGSMEWGLSSYSTSALINGFPATSNIGPSPPLADAAGLSAFVEGALQCGSMADPLNSNFGSSSLPADKVGFNPFEEGELPCNSVEGQLNGPPVGSSAAGATNFYPSCYHGTAPFPSAASFSGSSAISGNGAAAAAFCPSPKQEPFYYPSTGPLVENPPAISGNDPMATSVGMTAAAGPSQAEPSERNGPNISLFWTPEEQRQLNELCRRYGHIECNVARLAKIARPFHGKSIRDVALRIRWMEEKNSQRTKVVNSSRSHRAMREADDHLEYEIILLTEMHQEGPKIIRQIQSPNPGSPIDPRL